MDYNIIIPNGIFGKSNRKECISRRVHLQDMKDMAFTYVITIARTLGSDGGEIARRLAQKLNISFLILAAMGLAVVFGMMNIINMAHGEFIMLGAYVFTIACNHGVPFILSVVLAVIFVAAFGVVMDRLIICRLYSRPLDSIVVTWGISLAVTQIVQIIFGTSLPSVSVQE